MPKKIKYPISIDVVIKSAFPSKSKKIRKEYEQWHQKERLWHKLNKKPSDIELAEYIASGLKYDEGEANWEAKLIREWFPTFIKVSKPHLNVQDSDFPMRFKECLRRIIGGRSYGYNLPIFKQFWKHLLKTTAIKNGYPTYERTDEYFEKQTLAFIESLKDKGVDISWFRIFEAQIPDWRNEHRLKVQRQEAAIWRWLKLESHRINLLTLLKHRVDVLSHPKLQCKVQLRISKMSISHRKKSKK